MSKSQLRKELKGFSKEQLEDIILAAYDSSSKAKEYFEFFLNPDVKALMEKHIDAIAKELKRNKWGESKARVTVIRRSIKDFASFGVGAEDHARLVLYTFQMFLGMASSEYTVNATQRSAIAALACEYVTIAAVNGFFEAACRNIEVSIAKLARPSMANMLRTAVNITVEQLKTKMTV